MVRNPFGSNAAYRPEIDGLRACAVLPVLFFHAGSELFSGGYLGVDIFFVISGYLITSIIFNEMRQDRFSLADFYTRRARRILPALFVVLAASTLLAHAILLPEQLGSYNKSLLASLFFVPNVYFWRAEEYFAASAEETPLLHTWSLGIEEQYYLLFPWLFLWAWRSGPAGVLRVLLLVFIVSLAAAEFTVRYVDRETGFYLLHTRAWELAAGAICAIVLKERSVRENALASYLGIALIVLPVFFYSESTPGPSLYTLVPVAGAMLLVLYCHGSVPVARVLALKPVVWIGLISYSLYLWHQPLFAFARILGYEGAAAMSAASVLACLLAWLTFRFVETPIRLVAQGNPFRSPRVVLLSAIFGMLVFVYSAVPLSGSLSKDATFRDYVLVDSGYGGAGYKWTGVVGDVDAPSNRVLLYGDSHALQYAGGLDEAGKSRETAVQLVLHSACLSLPGVSNVYKGQIQPTCIDHYRKLLDALDNGGGDVIIAHRWNKLVAIPGGEVFGRVSEVNEARSVLLAGLQRLLDQIPETSRVVLVGNVPGSGLIAEGGLLKCRQKYGRDKSQCPENFPRSEGELDAFNAELEQLAARYDHVVFVNPYDYLCEQGTCYAYAGERLLYSDHAHLSLYSSKLIAAVLLQAL